MIGIDGSRVTAARLTGTEHYSVELLAALAVLDPPDEICVYLAAATRPEGLRLPGNPVFLPAERFWTLRRLAQEMRTRPPKLLFVPSYVVPPVHPRSVVTIHDLGYLVEPDCHEPRHRFQLEWTTRWNVHAASGIIAVSETTKRDLVDRLQVDPDRIEVIHHGISPRFAPATPDAVNAVRRQYGIGGRSILAVGTIHPRKNLSRLIQAFERLARRDASLQLVLCGGLGWQGNRVLRRAGASPFRDRIVHLGYVPDRDMAALYSSATVMAVPSLYEGFGLPVLEAMACGVPVVASNRSSLPEVADGAAVLVDPFDTESLATKLECILDDEAERATLIARGSARAKLFDWGLTAARTLAFLRLIRDNAQ